MSLFLKFHEYDMRLFLLLFLFLCIFFPVSLLWAQLDSSAPWPMFQNNVRHTGQTNKNILGVQKNPILKWSYTTNLPSGDFDSSPIIGADNTIYIGNADGNFYAITNGKKRWSHNIGGTYCTAALGKSNMVYIANSAGTVYALSNNNGGMRWLYNASSSGMTSPSVGSNETIYICGSDGYLYALTNGGLKWKYNATHPIYNSPAIGSNNVIYFGDSWGYFFAITNATPKWTYHITHGGGIFYSSPVIDSDNAIYFGGSDGYLYAVTNGNTNWTRPTATAIYSSPTIGPDGNIYVTSGSYLYSFTKQGLLNWSLNTGYSLNYSSPIIGMSGIIFLSSVTPNAILAVSNQMVKWAYPTGGQIYGSLAIGSEGTIYAGTRTDHTLYAVKENHEPILCWSSNAGYSNRGVNPTNGYNGQYFRFEVKYKDSDKDKPSTNQVWIDINNNGTFESYEKITMFSNSGSSYSNGIIYTNITRAYYAEDGHINYQFHFTDQYGYSQLPGAPSFNHIFIVTNTNIPHQLVVTNQTNYAGPCLGYTNNPVMSLLVWDTKYNHHLAELKVENAGTMVQGSDITNVKIWYDFNQNRKFDAYDQFVATLKWDESQYWTNNNILFLTNLSSPRYFFITMDVQPDAVYMRTFKAVIPIKGIGCSENSNAPATALTNQGEVYIGTYITNKKWTLHYVKTNGDNSLSGFTWANAWKTINYAATNHVNPVMAGHTVIISNGVYHEKITITNKGSSGSFIVFASFNPLQAVVDGSGNNYCFFLTNSAFVKIQGFQIKRTYDSGVYLSGACRSNFISDNNIYSNLYFGIRDMGSYNGIIQNSIFGPRQTNGIFVNTHDLIQYNKIFNNTVDGIQAKIANSIFSNQIYKNNGAGISMADMTYDSNCVYNNLFYSNGIGIYIEMSDNQKIKYNRIFRNSNIGIQMITSIAGGDGWVSDTVIRSNTICSNMNGGIVGGYAPVSLEVSYNDIYGPNQTSGIHMGCKNSIIRMNSIHDNGGRGLYLYENCYGNTIVNNNIYMNSDGIGLHGGWPQFNNNSFISNTISANVNNGICNDLGVNGCTFYRNIIKKNYYGIQFSVNNGNESDSIDDNQIYSNTYAGILIQSGSPSITRNTISSHSHYGIWFLGANYISVSQTNKIFNNLFYGIYLQTGSYNTIYNNRIYSNSISGIQVLPNYNSIFSNQIFGPNQDYGVTIDSGDYENVSRANQIYHNDLYGLMLINSATYNGITNNLISSNSEAGIYIQGALARNNYIIKNRLFGSNQKKGILISTSGNQICQSNRIYFNRQAGIDILNGWTNQIAMNHVYSNNQYGIFIEGNSDGYNVVASNQIFAQNANGIRIDNNRRNTVRGNDIFLNTPYGIVVTNQAKNNKLWDNKIINNANGVCINNTSSCSLYRNAIFKQQSTGIYLQDAAQNYIINNSLASNGLSSGQGVLLNNSSDNTMRNNIIAFTRNGYGINLGSGTGNSLTYNNVCSNSLGNYQNIVAGIGSISNNALWLGYDSVSTNFLYLSNQSPCIDAGDPADPVPVGGNDRIDMGWKEFTRPYISLALSKTVNSISLPGNLSAFPVPGAVIEYALNCKINSYGSVSANSVILQDQLFNNNLIYMTNRFVDLGWSPEYSTNHNPDHGYGSADFGPLPAGKTNIRWVRWKQMNVAGGLRTFYLKAVIK